MRPAFNANKDAMVGYLMKPLYFALVIPEGEKCVYFYISYFKCSTWGLKTYFMGKGYRNELVMLTLNKKLSTIKIINPKPMRLKTNSVLFSQLLPSWNKIFNNYLWDEFLMRIQVREGLHMFCVVQRSRGRSKARS